MRTSLHVVAVGLLVLSAVTARAQSGSFPSASAAPAGQPGHWPVPDHSAAALVAPADRPAPRQVAPATTLAPEQLRTTAGGPVKRSVPQGTALPHPGNIPQ